MDAEKAAELHASHKAGDHADGMLVAGDVHTVSSARGRITVRWYWCPACGCAYRKNVAFYDLARAPKPEDLARAREVERLERIAVGARLRELSGGSGLVPANAKAGQ